MSIKKPSTAGSGGGPSTAGVGHSPFGGGGGPGSYSEKRDTDLPEFLDYEFMELDEDEESELIAEIVSDKDSKENALDKMNEALAKQDVSARTVELNQPCSVTMTDKVGGYFKKPHIGGEKFLITRVYQGKKDLIIVCKSLESAKSSIEAEFTKADATRGLTGFNKWFDNLLVSHEERVLSEHKGTVEEKDAKDRYAEVGDKSFGSW